MKLRYNQSLKAIYGLYLYLSFNKKIERPLIFLYSDNTSLKLSYLRESLLASCFNESLEYNNGPLFVSNTNDSPFFIPIY
jgi:hypothetical protein